jgi:hypothetical protein
MKPLKFSVPRWHVARRAWKPGGGSPKPTSIAEKDLELRASCERCVLHCRVLCREPVPEANEAIEANEGNEANTCVTQKAISETPVDCDTPLLLRLYPSNAEFRTLNRRL